MSDALSLDARAKVNLRLRIFPPRADGYHPIDTVFCRTSLRDRVRLRVREGTGVRLATAEAPTGRANLAVRAAEAWLRAARRALAVEISLEKAVPQAAGLGGGSSDAAAVLRGLNALAGDALPASELLAIAASLGADVPFFVLDLPMAAGRGRGDRLQPLDPLPPVHALIAPGTTGSRDAARAHARPSRRSGTEPRTLARGRRRPRTPRTTSSPSSSGFTPSSST
jgi:4-diphosphocytidyl-2-C-methyl-D-erythritol kinase